jgi:prephenate dehydratase
MAVQVYYLGPPGSFGEQAAIRFLSERHPEAAGDTGPSPFVAELKPLPSHASVVEKVKATDGDLGVVAIENSLDGAVRETLDALLTARNVYVCGELVLAIEQHLIAASGTRIEDVSVVMSHPSALAQCHVFLERVLPRARLDAALSTAGAVEEALRTSGAAAIASRRAAELHGGIVIAEGIQDVGNNKTRFFLLGKADAAPSGDDKTSIAFSVPDRPGSVVGVMQEFSKRGINLTRIESRPSREELGKYVFLLDFQGHRLDAEPAAALAAMVADGAQLLPEGRPLGSYPRFVETN